MITPPRSYVAAWVLALAVLACGGPPAAAPANDDAIPLVGPPAGVATCPANGAADARAAALACYESRVKPAFAALAKSPRVKQFSFGDGKYLETIVTLTPDAKVEDKPRMPESDALTVASTTVLGDRGSLGMKSKVVQVTLVLRAAGMPTDGDMQLAFFLDGKTLETLYVYRVLGG